MSVNGEVIGARPDILDETFLDGVTSEEARNGEVRDILTLNEGAGGPYAMVQSRDPGDTFNASRAVGILRNELSRDVFILDNADDAQQRMQYAFEAIDEDVANGRGGLFDVRDDEARLGHDSGVMATAVRLFYNRQENRLQAVIGIVGNNQVYHHAPQDENGQHWLSRAVTPVAPDDAQYLTGETNGDGRSLSLSNIAVTVVDVNPGDRLIIVSDAIEREVGFPMHEQVIEVGDVGQMVRRLAGGPSDREKVALGIQVGTPLDAAAVPPAVDRAVLAADDQAVLAAPAADVSAVPANTDAVRRGRPRRWLGGRSVREAFADTRTRLRGSRQVPHRIDVVAVPENERRRFTWYDRAGAAATYGMVGGLTFLGGRRERYYRRHWDDEPYVGIEDQVERRRVIEERRQRKGLFLLLGAAAAFAVLKYYHADIVPSVFDHDGFDLTPWHGSSSKHAASLWDPRDGRGISGFFGYFLDDDTPTFPKQHGVNPGTIPAPRAPYLGNAPGSGSGGTGGAGSGAGGGAAGGSGAGVETHGTGAGGAAPTPTIFGDWQDQGFHVTGTGPYTDSYEGLFHQEGHALVGAGFDGDKAHQAYLKVHEQFGDDFITFDNPHGPDIYPISGDNVGIAHTGTVHWSSPAVAKAVHDAILDVAGVA